MKSISKKEKCFASILSIAYVVALLYILFFRRIGVTYAWTYAEYLSLMHNFIPFKSVCVLLTTPVLTEFVIVSFIVNFIGNVILFIPWGVLLPICFRSLQSFKRFLVLTLIIIILVESVQIFTMLGIFDIEDILLNTAGACIGFKAFKKFFQKNNCS